MICVYIKIYVFSVPSSFYCHGPYFFTQDRSSESTGYDTLNSPQVSFMNVIAEMSFSC